MNIYASVIIQVMNGVIDNDPDAVILVLSDHGVKANKYLWEGPADYV